jgi:pimeloyl-ACP methyl ester carboxylesterase
MVNVVRTNGGELAYERVGEGPPLVFVHGGGEDGRVWQLARRPGVIPPGLGVVARSRMTPRAMGLLASS